MRPGFFFHFIFRQSLALAALRIKEKKEKKMEKETTNLGAGGNSLISNSHACERAKWDGRWKWRNQQFLRYFSSHKNQISSFFNSPSISCLGRLWGGKRKKGFDYYRQSDDRFYFQFYPSGPLLCQNVCPFTVVVNVGWYSLHYTRLVVALKFGHLYAQRHLYEKETTWIN